MVGRPRSSPGFRFVSWLTLTALLGALVASVAAFDSGRAQDDQSGGFPPGGYPRSVSAGDEQFLFDRQIPLDPASLTEIGTDGDATLFAGSDSEPFERVYVDLDGGEDGQLGRYLPLQLGSDDPSCLTDDAELSVITTGDGANYAFAGEETDLPADSLVDLGVADFGDGAERTLSADRSEPPFPEFFVSGDEGEQLRFVLLTNEVPEQLTGEIPIGDQTFTVGGNAVNEVDPGSLIDIGCVGPFPLRAANDVTAPYSELYAPVGNGLLRLVAQDDGQDDSADEEGDSDAVEPGTPDDAAAGDQPVDEPVTQEEDATAEIATDEIVEEGQDGADGADGADGEDGEDGEDVSSGDAAIPPLPDDVPAEVTVGDERFLLDRSVPLDRGDLERVDRQDSQILYARSAEGPFDAVYISLPPRNETALARYLPERLGQSGVPCLADAAPNSTLEFNGGRYLFAGYETDITTDDLVALETGDGTEAYIDSVESDSAELFLPDDTGLARFVPLGDDSRPGIAADSVTFAGSEFTFAGDVTGSVDPAALAVVGCFGPFPMYSDPSTPEPPFGDLYLVAGGLLFQYTPVGGSPEPEVPTEVATETPVPTEIPTEVPTEVPTDTPVPTETPTEVPTETPVPPEIPTETAVPTEAPTETPVPTEAPTETPVPTEVPTVAPVATEAPTETVVPEEEPTEAPEATEPPEVVPTSTPLPPLAPPPPELPSEIQVQSASYLFSDVTVDVDVTTLVQVDVIVVQNVELTVYARQEFQGAAPELFCVGPDGQVVGRYVPAAVVRPQPPQDLPEELETEGSTYVFNQVNVDIDVTTLVQMNVVVVQNVELTLYAPQNVSGTPTLLYAVAPGGQIAGVYLQATIVAGAATPVPTPQLQPPAVIPTLPPDAAPPPAATAAVSRCTGSAGALDVSGLPERLPRRIQYRGTAFSFAATEEASAAGALTRLGCAGPFAVYSTDQAPANERLYLQLDGEQDSPLYRYNAARTFTVEVEVTGQVRVVRTSDANYELVDSYQRSVYSSVTAILFVQDAEDSEPDLIYALRVDADVIGRYEPESESLQAPSDELTEQAQAAYINPDLLLNGRRYVLTEILTPQGSTTNGFVTLYAIPNQETPDLFLGVDPREPDLLLFRRVGDGS